MIRIEKFKPKIKPGRIIPRGNKIIFETTEPFNQIVLPLTSTDFLLLCNGQYSMQEIIQKLYHRSGTVHFKTLFNILFQLKDRDFLENGDLLQARPNEISPKTDILTRSPKTEVYLAKRIFNDKTNWGLFYILAMLSVVASFIAISFIPLSKLEVPFLRINGSYFIGLLCLFVTLSLFISVKNIFKGMLLLLGTGRLYNFKIVFNGYSAYFNAGNESLFLIENPMLLFIFHLCMSMFYILLASIFFLIDPVSPLAPHIYLVAIFLTIRDLDPFSESDLSLFFKSFYDDDHTKHLSNYLKNISFLNFINPNRQGHKKEKTIVFVFSHLAIIWAVSSLAFLASVFFNNHSLLFYSMISEGWGEKICAGILLLIFCLFSFRVIRNFIYIIFDNAIAPLKSAWDKSRRRKKSISSKDLNNEAIQSAIKDLPLMKYFNSQQLDDLISKCEIVNYEEKTKIIVEGDIGNHIFVLLKGSAEVIKTTTTQQRQKVSTLYPVCIFGEIAVLEEKPRAADVIANENCTVLKIPGKAVRENIKTADFNQEISKIIEEIIINQYFTSSPVFKDLSGEIVQQFISSGKVRYYSKDEVVFEQDTRGDSFYLVLRGKVRLYINNRSIKSIGQGGFFGEISVIADVPRTCTVVVDEPSILYRVQKDNFWDVLSSDFEIAMFIESIGEARFKEDMEILKNGQIQLG